MITLPTVELLELARRQGERLNADRGLNLSSNSEDREVGPQRYGRRVPGVRLRRHGCLFLQYMIGHHEGAVLMVEELLASGNGQEPNLFQLAQHIDADQRVEIARMRQLLARL